MIEIIIDGQKIEVEGGSCTDCVKAKGSTNCFHLRGELGRHLIRIPTGRVIHFCEPIVGCTLRESIANGVDAKVEDEVRRSEERWNIVSNIRSNL